MNRRKVIRGLGALALGASIRECCEALAQGGTQGAAPSPPSRPLPGSVAGVRLIDSSIALEATKLSRLLSPPFLFNHAVRTYLFGALIGRASGQKFDEEVLYLACSLHDLGLTDRFAGDLPFEIQGAEAAKGFLEQKGYSKERVALVWDGIAMHASLIGSYKQPEIALVGAGAGADVVAPDASQIKKVEVDEVVAAFPRLGLKTEFVKTCADVIRRHPKTAGCTFMRDIAERYVADFKPHNICDAIAASPFAE